jgi:hypothetical protein
MNGSKNVTAIFERKKEQTITFTALAQQFIGDADFDAAATASSELSVSYSSSNTDVATIVNGLVHIVGAGSAIITASQEGNDWYNAATPVSQTLTVVKKEQIITFSALGEKAYGDADFAPGAEASSGLDVVYTSSDTSVATIVDGNVHIVGLGTTLIAASQEGNYMFHAAAALTRSLTVADKQAPSQPQALTAAKTTEGRIQLLWQPSTDDIGVTGYYIYVDGVRLNATPVTATSFVTNAPSGNLIAAYTVKATDAAGNLSEASASELYSTSNSGGANQTLATMQVFPNPSSGVFHLSLNSEQTGNIAITVYTGGCTVVHRLLDNKSAVLYQRSFNLQNLPKGMYLINVVVGTYNSTRTILIQ